MKKVELPSDADMLEKQRTEFTKDELLDILDFYLQYKPIFNKSSNIDLNYPASLAAHDFTLLLYKYEIIDFNYFDNMDKIKNKYGKKYVRELSKEKLDLFEIITIFTFIHRGERHAGGFYRDCTKNDTYYNLLCRLEEIKDEL